MAVRVAIPHEARSATGAILPGAKLSITKYGGGAATVWTGTSVWSLARPQPLLANPDGTFSGYVEPGRYSVSISFAGDTETHEWAALNTSQDDWTAPSFTNGWAIFAGRTVGYRKNSEGFVVMRGSIASGTVGSSAFTLPTGYRPAATELFPVTTFGGVGRVDITSSGTVVPTSPSNNAFVVLDPIRFYAGT